MMDRKQQGILIVDDDPAIREVLSTLLAAEGYARVYVAADATEALSLLTAHVEQVYLLLLDIRLPGMSGLALMKHLANVHQHPVGIVIITGYASIESANEFYRTGTDTVLAMNFISKPLNLKNLMTEIEAVLDKVHDKRMNQATLSGAALAVRLTALESKFATLDSIPNLLAAVRELRLSQPSLLGALGMEVLKAAILGAAVLAFLYLGLGDVLRALIAKSP